MTETDTNTLQTIIGEFKNLEPDIAKALVFKSNGEIIAASEDNNAEQTQTLIANLNNITHAECIGGIENLTIQDANSQLVVAAIDEVYLVTVSSRTANQKIIKSLTQVIVPAVIRSAFRAIPVAAENHIKPEEASLEQVEPAVITEQESKIEPIIELQSQPEPVLPKAPTTQFMVENISGLLVATDTVRIESEVIANWKELYGDKQFTAVSIETLAGKTITCKFKSQKDTKASAKGTIGIPDKILQALECNKGKLVMVKPVIQ